MSMSEQALSLCSGIASVQTNVERCICVETYTSSLYHSTNDRPVTGSSPFLLTNYLQINYI